MFYLIKHIKDVNDGAFLDGTAPKPPLKMLQIKTSFSNITKRTGTKQIQFILIYNKTSNEVVRLFKKENK